MKKLFLEFLFIFVLVFSTNILYAQDCKIKADWCTPWVYNATMTIYLPEFPNCPIEVAYDYQFCNRNGEYVMNIHICGAMISTFPECNEVNDLYFNIDKAHILFDKLWDALTVELFNEQMSSNPDLVDCNKGGGIKFEAYYPNCVRYAYYGNIDGKRTVKIFNCNDDICCMRGTKICWDDNLKQIVEVPYSIVYISGECEVNPANSRTSVSSCTSPCK